MPGYGGGPGRRTGNHDADVTRSRLKICYNLDLFVSANMKLNLKRMFARSMTGGLESAEDRKRPSSARPAKRKMMFITLAGILAIVGTLAGAYYFAMRPVTLRIAVGPANSDDIKVVQALSQAFAQTHGQIRLRPVPTEGAAASAKALADGKADLAIIRGDLAVPEKRPGRRHAAQERCGAVGATDRQSARAGRRARRSPKFRSSPGAASASSAAPRPMSICSR